jgi:serine/threonine protein kinase
MSDWNPKANEIFLDAQDCDSPAARQAFLDAACGADLALREQVESLLDADRAAPSILDRHAAELAIGSESSVCVGTQIGPYKIRELIGEGGMGEVYVAEQERPVRRKVALKIIRPGMATRDVIARFEAERQALALMDHPNIARVFDAGSMGREPSGMQVRNAECGMRSEQGMRSAECGVRSEEESINSELRTPNFEFRTRSDQPFFVMELVQGPPITDYCDAKRLTTRERLTLFLSVCRAVQHAHQKGIIHRDLKPSNVLVPEIDGAAVPKVIDFGVAKAIDQKLTEKTVYTQFSQMIGTPTYMSPEQAGLGVVDVDTRSDIYSLGVLLYELLTGTTPFDGETLRHAGFEEMQRIIREQEPRRPSAQVSTLAAEALTTVAHRRGSDPKKLRDALSGELDWIVMKCLEKDRNRRYETANGLARDIERYLNDEPVQACPPSAIYRLKKFVRRNKIAAAFVLLLVAAVAGLTVSNIQTRRNERRALTESARAQAVSDLLQEMLASSNPDQVKGSKYTVRELLDDFSAGLGDQLAGEPEVEAAIRSVIGNAYWRLGMFVRAEVHLKKALDLRRQVFGAGDERVADSLVDYAWNLAEQSRNSEAERHARDALSIYRQQNIDPDRTVRALWALQNVLLRQSRRAEAEEVANEALALAGDDQNSDVAYLPNILHSLAEAKSSEGKHEEAENLARRSVAMHRRLHGDHHPETAFGLYFLGIALRGQQRFAEAEPPLREALDIFREHYTPDHNFIQIVTPALKSVLDAQGDRAGLEALAREETEHASRSDSPDYHVRLAQLLMSDSQGAARDVAHRLIQRAIEEYAQVALDYPDNLNRRVNALNGCVTAIGHCAQAPGFEGEVIELNRQLEAELPKLVADFPDSSECQWQAANLYRHWAVQLLPYTDNLSQTERALRESIKLHETVTQTDPKRPGVWLYLADRNIVLGYLNWLTARPEDAETAYRRAIEIFEQHEDDEVPATKSSSVASLINMDSVWLAYYLGCTDRKDKAAEFIRKASRSAWRLTETSEFAHALYWTALVQVRLGDVAGYRETCNALVDVPVSGADDFTKARTILTWCHAPAAIEDLSLPVKRAEELDARNSLEQPHFVPYILGAAYYRNGDHERAAVEFEKSIAVYPSDPPLGDRIINWQRLFLAMTKWQLGQRDAARHLLTEIQPAINEELQSLATPFHYRLTLEVLRREADSLIGPKDAEVAVGAVESVENAVSKNSAPTTDD